MIELGEKIWQSSSAREIMNLARHQFREAMENGIESKAHIALASTHYSLVKRYTSGLKLPMGVWHLWRAAVHAKATKPNSFDQIDVVSTILSETPRWLGGNLYRALGMVMGALEYCPGSESGEMFAHTRALLLIRRAKIEEKLGRGIGSAQIPSVLLYHQAEKLRNEVLAEADQKMAKRQWCRIAFAIGSFYLDHHQNNDYYRESGFRLIKESLFLALEHSRDQEVKILQWMKSREITRDLF